MAISEFPEKWNTLFRDQRKVRLNYPNKQDLITVFKKKTHQTEI